MSTPLRVGLWNLGPGAAKAKRTGMDALARRSTMAVLVEVGDRRPEVSSWAKAHGWRVWHPHGQEGGHSGHCAIAWHPDIDVTDRELVMAVPYTKGIGGVGAAGPNFGAKWLHRVSVGDQLHVVGAHFIPSAMRRDLPPDERRKRRQHHTDHQRALLRMLDGLSGTVAVAADWNADPAEDAELLAPVLPVLTGWTHTATHGRASRFDHIVVRPPEVTVHKLPSDHRGVVRVL